MKTRILTILAAIMLALGSASAADVLWEGSKDLGNNSSKLRLEPANYPQLAGVTPGSKITVEFTMTEGKSGHTCYLTDGGSTQAKFTETNLSATNMVEGVLNAGATSTTFTVAEADAATIRELGFRVCGKHIVITKVILDIESESVVPVDPDERDPYELWPTSDSRVIWNGEHDLNTGRIEIPNDKTTFTAGTQLEIIFNVYGPNAKVNILNPSLKPYEPADNTATNREPDGTYAMNRTSTVFTIDDNNNIHSMAAKGIRISGYNVIVLQVRVLGESIENPDDDIPAGETEIWSGSFNEGNWTEELNLNASLFAGVVAGDKLTCSFTVNPGADYGQIWICNMAYENYEATTNSATNLNVDYPTYSPGTLSTTFTFAASDLPTILVEGLKIKGYECTITNIYLDRSSGGGSSNPGDDDPLNEGDNILFSGSNNFETWSNALVFTGAQCKGLKAGDKVNVYFTVNAGCDYGQLRFSSADWNILTETTDKTGTNRNPYSCYDPDVNMTTFTIDETDVADIIANGFILSGENVTVSKVTIESEATSTVKTLNADTNTPVEYYNLQGVRIFEPTASSIVIRRQGNKIEKIKIAY